MDAITALVAPLATKWDNETGEVTGWTRRSSSSWSGVSNATKLHLDAACSNGRNAVRRSVPVSFADPWRLCRRCAQPDTVADPGRIADHIVLQAAQELRTALRDPNAPWHARRVLEMADLADAYAKADAARNLRADERHPLTGALRKMAPRVELGQPRHGWTLAGHGAVVGAVAALAARFAGADFAPLLDPYRRDDDPLKRLCGRLLSLSRNGMSPELLMGNFAAQVAPPEPRVGLLPTLDQLPAVLVGDRSDWPDTKSWLCHEWERARAELCSALEEAWREELAAAAAEPDPPELVRTPAAIHHLAYDRDPVTPRQPLRRVRNCSLAVLTPLEQRGAQDLCAAKHQGCAGEEPEPVGGLSDEQRRRLVERPEALEIAERLQWELEGDLVEVLTKALLLVDERDAA